MSSPAVAAEALHRKLNSYLSPRCNGAPAVSDVEAPWGIFNGCVCTARGWWALKEDTSREEQPCSLIRHSRAHTHTHMRANTHANTHAHSASCQQSAGRWGEQKERLERRRNREDAGKRGQGAEMKTGRRLALTSVCFLCALTLDLCWWCHNRVAPLGVKLAGFLRSFSVSEWKVHTDAV